MKIKNNNENENDVMKSKNHLKKMIKKAKSNSSFSMPHKNQETSYTELSI